MPKLAAGAWIWLPMGIAIAGCTTLAGLDKEYISEESRKGTGGAGNGGIGGAAATGGTNSGGAAGGGTGGSTAGASGAGAGGTDGSGGAGGASCAAGEKYCEVRQFCAPPSPLVGCAAEDCEPCPAPPPNGIGICRNDQCDVECNDGYEGPDCQPVGSGGTGGADTGGAGGATGTGGSGGSGGSCDPTQCGPCPLPASRGCCQSNGACGCAWPGAPCFGP